METARATPGRLAYSTSGVATTNHIAMGDIPGRERAQMTHVPFRGAPKGVTALLGRQVDVVAEAWSWRPQAERGEFRLLSIWMRARLPSFPDASTLREPGHDMMVTSPYGSAGPKGMEAEVVDTLHREFKEAFEDEAGQAVVGRWDMPNEYLGPREYLAFALERVAYEREMVARLGPSID